MNTIFTIIGIGLLSIPLLIGGVIFMIIRRNRPTVTPPAAATAGGTTGAGAPAPAPGGSTTTSTTTTTSPTPAKWSGWVKNGAMLAAVGLVLWLAIIGPADWMGAVVQFNWTTSTALGAWLSNSVGNGLANLLMWGLVGGGILLAVLVWTGKHKGVAKNVSSIPFATIATLAVVGYLGFYLISGVTTWLNKPTVETQILTFGGATTENVFTQERQITVGPLEEWEIRLTIVQGPNKHPDGYYVCPSLNLPGVSKVFTSRPNGTARYRHQFTQEAREKLVASGVTAVVVQYRYHVGGPGGSDPCTQEVSQY